ncbi:hypothetical protein L332_05195 [Agrococcus pavilionensis RW1]|uniref:Uncharacterized protein n=1 Tax=Agrococcus pavilionensis RW1 TaxID=1330458 RepID=U1LPE8_9MICO|nr:hypothetical protein L332_05195 [Agrococcus pavilionensis RW1]
MSTARVGSTDPVTMRDRARSVLRSGEKCTDASAAECSQPIAVGGS